MEETFLKLSGIIRNFVVLLTASEVKDVSYLQTIDPGGGRYSIIHVSPALPNTGGISPCYTHLLFVDRDPVTCHPVCVCHYSNLFVQNSSKQQTPHRFEFVRRNQGLPDQRTEHGTPCYHTQHQWLIDSICLNMMTDLCLTSRSVVGDSLESEINKSHPDAIR